MLDHLHTTVEFCSYPILLYPTLHYHCHLPIYPRCLFHIYPISDTPNTPALLTFQPPICRLELLAQTLHSRCELEMHHLNEVHTASQTFAQIGHNMRTLHCPTYFGWTPGGLWVDFAGVQVESRWILLKVAQFLTK
jgi:hypothetical protein